MLALIVRTILISMAVVVLNFAIPRFLPGDPLDAIDAAAGESGAAPLSAAARENLRAYYGLNKPMAEQFVDYVVALSKGDLGWSIAKRAPVSEIIGNRLPWTLGLVGSAAIVASLIGAFLGIVSTWRGPRTERVMLNFATVIEAIPEFLIGMVLLLTLAVAIPIFPLTGGRSLFTESGMVPAADIAWHLALPFITLVIASFGSFALVSRGASAEAARSTFIVTARAKGLSEWRILFAHVLPNVLPPIWTMFGLRLGGLVGGAVVVERLFGVPGVGLLAIEAIASRDYPVLQAFFLLTGLSVVFATFFVDATYRLMTPYARD